LYLIDTNIFLEILLAQEKKDECIALFKEIENDNISAAVTKFSIHSIEVIMGNYRLTDELRIFLESLSELKSLHIYTTNISDEINAIDEMELGLDFDDALQVSAARALNAEIISFDKHFNNLEGIQRLNPSDVVYTGND
jgi:predicted nucleic acid-binding protein